MSQQRPGILWTHKRADCSITDIALGKCTKLSSIIMTVSYVISGTCREKPLSDLNSKLCPPHPQRHSRNMEARCSILSHKFTLGHSPASALLGHLVFHFLLLALISVFYDFCRNPPPSWFCISVFSPLREGFRFHSDELC